MDSLLFTPVTLGPLTLRNRSIRSAAFESMCPGNVPSPQLLAYHRSVAAGGGGGVCCRDAQRTFVRPAVVDEAGDCAGTA